MRALKKLIAVLSVAMIFTVGLSGCNMTWDEFVASLPEYNPYAYDKKSGDFYYLVKEDVETEEEYVCITGLTEAGKQKDLIVIPPVLDGYRVRSLGKTTVDIYGSEGYKKIRGDFTKVYIPNTVEKFNVEDFVISGVNLQDYVFNCGMHFEFLGKWIFNASYNIYNPPINVYLPELEYLKDREKYENVTFIKANLQYDSNIPEVTVKHFIDNVPTGSKITAPPYEPERAGYKFAGWYKESECINAWNFETDVTETIELAKGEEITEEIMQAENYATTLYAKWVII